MRNVASGSSLMVTEECWTVSDVNVSGLHVLSSMSSVIISLQHPFLHSVMGKDNTGVKAHSYYNLTQKKEKKMLNIAGCGVQLFCKS